MAMDSGWIAVRVVRYLKGLFGCLMRLLWIAVVMAAAGGSLVMLAARRRPSEAVDSC